jgi:hypothetical protein
MRLGRWQLPSGAEAAERGGADQLRAYDAGLTDDPGCWVQPVQLTPDPRLDPASPFYDEIRAWQDFWENRGPEPEGDWEAGQ